jgi:hypothetical protein
MLHHMATILNQKWPTKYKNSPIWAKFGFQHESQKLGSNYFLLCSHTSSAATHYGGYSYKVS